MIMENKFSNFIEDKIKAELKKRNLLYKNLKKEDLSNRDTSEHINNRFLNFLKKNLTNPKCKKSLRFIKISISEIEQEIIKEKIALETQNKIKVKVKKTKFKKKIPNSVQPTVKGKPIPYNQGLTHEFIKKHWHLVRPCDPNEIIVKKEKKLNKFNDPKFKGYY